MSLFSFHMGYILNSAPLQPMILFYFQAATFFSLLLFIYKMVLLSGVYLIISAPSWHMILLYFQGGRDLDHSNFSSPWLMIFSASKGMQVILISSSLCLSRLNCFRWNTERSFKSTHEIFFKEGFRKFILNSAFPWLTQIALLSGGFRSFSTPPAGRGRPTAGPMLKWRWATGHCLSGS